MENGDQCLYSVPKRKKHTRSRLIISDHAKWNDQNWAWDSYNVPTKLTQSHPTWFPSQDPLIIFTLSNARQFYSSKGHPLAFKELKNYLPQPFPSRDPLIDLLCLTPDDFTRQRDTPWQSRGQNMKLSHSIWKWIKSYRFQVNWSHPMNVVLIDSCSMFH